MIRGTQDGDATEPPMARLTRPLRVIVADDDLDSRQVVAFALRLRGCEVVEAGSGAELLKALGDALSSGLRQRRPDVIISDICMPGFTGLEILTGLRNPRWMSGFFRSTSVVLMSACADAKTRAEATRLGVETFFEKPFDIAELVKAVVDVPRVATESERPYSFKVTSSR